MKKYGIVVNIDSSIDMNKYGHIYLFENTINGKKYYGQSIGVKGRINEHIGNTYKEITHPLYDAIRKYGLDCFRISIIDNANNVDELNDLEIDYIAKHNTNNRNFGYNIETGGKNSLASQETKEKMSKSHLGIKQSEEWIENRIAKMGTEEAKKYGKEKTEEEKQWLSENSPKFWQGKERDELIKLKISKTKMENGLSLKQKEIICKKVYKINIKTNEIEKVYESTNDASKIENVNQSTVSRWCSDDKIIDGFIWTYKTIDELNKKQITHEVTPKEPRIVSQETREKLSAARKGIKQSQEWIDKRIETVAKPVIKIHKSENIILERFTSLANAGRENMDGLSYESIQRKCNGSSKNDGEYIWCYEEDFQNNTIKTFQHIETKQLVDFSEGELMKIYNEHTNNNASIRSLSDKYSINFSTLNTYIQNKNKKELKYSPDKNYVAVCKKTNKKFEDYVNKSGALTRHIQETYPSETLASKFLRKKIEKETGDFWYCGYFDIVQA